MEPTPFIAFTFFKFGKSLTISFLKEIDMINNTPYLVAADLCAGREVYKRWFVMEEDQCGNIQKPYNNDLLVCLRNLINLKILDIEKPDC